MRCQVCNSDRVLELDAHSRDCNTVVFQGKESNSYLPYISGICGGDDVSVNICLDCGQTQGTFPKAFETDEDEDFEDEEED